MEILAIAAVFFIPSTLNFLLIPKDLSSSDHYGYLSQVLAIKDNHHRFIKTRPNFLINNEMIAPQFLPWVLSFLPKHFLRTYSKYLSILFNLASSLLFTYFIYRLYYLANIDGRASRDLYIAISSIIYITTPFSYNFINARNVGLSARGLGLLLGQSLLYTNILYVYTNDLFYIAIATCISLLIILSSKFALQLLVFATPIMAFLYREAWIVSELLIAFALFIILFRRYALKYISAQVRFRIFYFKHMAKIYLLHNRYSIWRDFIWDFWLMTLCPSYSSKYSMAHKCFYFYENSLLMLMHGFPFLIPVLYKFISTGIYADHNAGISALFTPIATCVFIFLSTTLRATRFLGEPERYLEFCVGLIAVASSALYADNLMFVLMLTGMSILVSAAQLVTYKKIVLPRKNELTRPIVEIRKILAKKEEAGTQIRLMCNNMLTAKVLGSETQKILYDVPISSQMGPFEFRNVFQTYPYIRQEMIIPLVRHYRINYLAIDKSRNAPDYAVFKTSDDLSFETILDNDNWTLFEIKVKPQRPGGEISD